MFGKRVPFFVSDLFVVVNLPAVLRGGAIIGLVRQQINIMEIICTHLKKGVFSGLVSDINLYLKMYRCVSLILWQEALCKS